MCCFGWFFLISFSLFSQFEKILYVTSQYNCQQYVVLLNFAKNSLNTPTSCLTNFMILFRCSAVTIPWDLELATATRTIPFSAFSRLVFFKQQSCDLIIVISVPDIFYPVSRSELFLSGYFLPVFLAALLSSFHDRHLVAIRFCWKTSCCAPYITMWHIICTYYLHQISRKI